MSIYLSDSSLGLSENIVRQKHAVVKVVVVGVVVVL